MKKTIKRTHLAINIRGFLKHYAHRSMSGLMIDDNGRKMSDAEIRANLQRHLALGHKLIPSCDERECPDFDYFEHGCPGHDIHYYDNNDNEITKEEYEQSIYQQS